MTRSPGEPVLADIPVADLRLAALAFGVVLAARVTPPLAVTPFVVLVAVGPLAWAGVRRRTPVLLALALLLTVTARSATELRALQRPLPRGTVSGVGRLVTDPRPGPYGERVVVDLAGRRYDATAPRAAAVDLSSFLAGQHLWVEGGVRPLSGAPPGWMRANHLAGRMTLREVRPSGGEDLWFRVPNVLRRRIDRSTTGMDDSRRALFLGLVIGDDRFQSDLQRYRFRAAGLSHLLAVSGQNVSFVLALVAPVLRRAGPRLSLCVSVPLLGLFALVTRAEPPVLRAVIMALIGLLALRSEREVGALRLLALTVVVLVLVDPLIVHSVGFQLSALATLGLVLLARRLAELLPGPRALRSALGVTLAAQLATAPVILGFSPALPAVAPLANLLAVPVAGAVMMAGLTAGPLAGSIRADVAGLLMTPVGWLVDFVDGVATGASRAPLVPLSPWRFTAVVILVVLWLSARRNHARWYVRSVPIVLLVLLLIPRPLGTGTMPLASSALLQRQPCGPLLLDLNKGADGVEVLEALQPLGVTSVAAILHDDSPSARRAAHLVAEQLALDPRAVLIQNGEDPMADSSGPGAC